MLRIIIPSTELWDEYKQEFVTTKEQTLLLEHSLVSLSKWESKWCKPFITKDRKTIEETIDYIRCMTLTQNVDPDVYNYITNDNIEKVNEYIEAPMTATWFSEEKRSKASSEQITSELVYFWMFTFRIPKDCEKWHFNRLMTLIRIFSAKNQPDKKMSKRDIMNQNRALNEARRKRLNSKG
jgi:hypothetical protein